MIPGRLILYPAGEVEGVEVRAPPQDPVRVDERHHVHLVRVPGRGLEPGQEVHDGADGGHPADVAGDAAVRGVVQDLVQRLLVLRLPVARAVALVLVRQHGQHVELGEVVDHVSGEARRAARHEAVQKCGDPREWWWAMVNPRNVTNRQGGVFVPNVDVAASVVHERVCHVHRAA